MDAFLAFLAGGLLQAGFALIAAYTLLATHVTIAAVTIYLHRAQAHRALQLHPCVSHFFRFWLWLTTGMVTREWVAIHRRHHAHCDSAGDPHSPLVSGIRAVLWTGAELYREAARDRAAVARFGAGTPDDWIERALYSRYAWQGVGLLLVLDLALFGVIGATVWAIQMLWIPVLAAGVVNGLGHYWGYRNFDCEEAATNILPFGLLIGGEELHNNHHTFACSAKLSQRWYEFDIGWLYIRLLAACGLATVRQLPSRPRLRERQGEADLLALHAVLANRAHLTAQLTRALRGVCRAELRALHSVPVRAALKLLGRDPGHLTGAQRQQLGLILARSRLLSEIQQLRVELARLWDRSHATPDQLLVQLRLWCRHAAASELAPLRHFASRLQRYA